MQSQVRKTQIKEPYFGLQNDTFLWTSQCEQGYSSVGKKKSKRAPFKPRKETSDG